MARGRNQRIGLAGEHFVASELLQQGWNVALTFGNTERTDLLAEDAESRRLAAFQVKAKRTRGSWRLPGPIDPSDGDRDDEWFAFVDFAVDDGEKPAIYLLPRDHMAALGSAQEHYSSKSGGKIVNIKDISGYKETWSLLDKPAAKAKPRLDDWVREGCQDRKLRRMLARS